MAAPKDSGYVATGDPTKPGSDAAVPFREIVPAPDHSRITGIQHRDAHNWCEPMRKIDAPA